MTPPAREVQFKIMVSEDERAMIDALAEVDGLSASDVVRQLVRRAHTERFGDKKAKKKT